jgi:hypothetical protein
MAELYADEDFPFPVSSLTDESETRAAAFDPMTAVI